HRRQQRHPLHRPEGPREPGPLDEPEGVQGTRGRRGRSRGERLRTDRGKGAARHESCMSPPNRRDQEPPVDEPAMDDATKKTVLLVEDNEDNLVVYRTILDHVGYNVLEARDGEEGVSRARQEHPDLILMDISIPKIDGWEATRR